MQKTDNLLDAVVLSRAQLTDDIISLEIGSQHDVALPAFEAGSHVDVHLEPGLMRQYSISNSPQSAVYQLAILKEQDSRGGSVKAHQLLTPGTFLKISPPRNNFRLQPSPHKAILVAGGVGVTPLLSMAYQLQLNGDEFEFHYCTRSKAKTAFLAEFSSGLFGDRAQLYHSREEGIKFDASVVTASPSVDCHLYICGPSGFISHVEAAAQANGWNSQNIHCERFSAEAPQGGNSFRVIAQRSGIEVEVGENETIVDALDKVGVSVDVSCEQGICGSCVTKLIDGEADHQDMYLTDEEHASNQLITPCCSRAKSSSLTLDL